MPKLERCSCTSVGDMNSSLRALQIEKCEALKEFDLFENDDKFEIEQRSWLPRLSKLTLRDCPHLEVLNSLPPSSTYSELFIYGVSTLTNMEVSSGGKLSIGYLCEDGEENFYGSSDKLRILDDKILAFCNLRNLKSMIIEGCRNLTSFSLEGFSHLVSLKSLEISMCGKLFSSHVMPEPTLEDETAANGKAFPSLQSLSIMSCGITGKWLSLLLRHAPHLEELQLKKVEEEEDSQSNRISAWEYGDALTRLAQDEPVHIPLKLISSLKKIRIDECPLLTFNLSEEGFSVFTSLQEIVIKHCPRLLSSLVHKDGNDNQVNRRWLLPTSIEELTIHSNESLERLQPIFPGDLTNLKKLDVWNYGALESLQLHSCTALENLSISNCGSLNALEGLQSLGGLRDLAVSYCPSLPPCLESFSRQGYELFPRLETLEIDDPSVLTTSFCEHLTSLQHLKLGYLVLTEEQGTALVLLKSLQQLKFEYCSDLVDLPAGLHLLPSLKKLEIWCCPGISRLPETGFPDSLEELEIVFCSKALADQCRALATSKLNVKISCCG